MTLMIHRVIRSSLKKGAVMCMPHGSGTPLFLDRPERSRPKRHIEFDKRRLEPDPDFIDERTKPYKPKKSTGLLNGLKALFGG